MEVEESAVHDFLLILEEHKKNCERQGKYVEADIAKKRLAELRQHEENRKMEGLRSRQIAQRLGVEEAHMLEFQQFNAMWDAKMGEYEQRATELLEAMRARHTLDARELRRRSSENDGATRRPKFSKELLDLRKIEVSLARQGDYAEAHKVKLKADALEEAERERMAAEREQQVSLAEAKCHHKQENELNALRQRIQAGAEEQRKARQNDLERLMQRYNNVKAELESQQNAERLRNAKGVYPMSSSVRVSSASARLSSPRASTSRLLKG
uniref:Uncharacterized protein n=1 Tax=Chrysotila carterae TaxID=13221 RepID=A0A7S4F8F8_CHRCT|mmetsp:Transcript_1477/g.2927  ORF Transcript_1477/g.2927 Transcript_1477/m.2927 type:complete len:269 (+) Transcript_1477:59-865(+)